MDPVELNKKACHRSSEGDRTSISIVWADHNNIVGIKNLPCNLGRVIGVKFYTQSSRGVPCSNPEFRYDLSGHIEV